MLVFGCVLYRDCGLLLEFCVGVLFCFMAPVIFSPDPEDKGYQEPPLEKLEKPWFFGWKKTSMASLGGTLCFTKLFVRYLKWRVHPHRDISCMDVRLM